MQVRHCVVTGTFLIACCMPIPGIEATSLGYRITKPSHIRVTTPRHLSHSQTLTHFQFLFSLSPSPQVKFTTPPKARHSLSGIKRAALKPLQPHATSSKLLVGGGSPRLATIGKNPKKTDLVRGWEYENIFVEHFETP